MSVVYPKKIDMNNNKSFDDTANKPIFNNEENNPNSLLLLGDNRSKKSKSIIESKSNMQSYISKDYDEDKENDNDNDNENESFSDARRLKKTEKICDSDSEDYDSDLELNVKWVINPDNKYKRYWDIAIGMLILYSVLTLPYRIAFIDEENQATIIIDYFFDALFVTDIILNFFSAYLDTEENVVKNRKKIVEHYIKTWFILDFISSFPFNFFLENIKNYNNLGRILRIPRFYRIIKIFKMLRFVKVVKKGKINSIKKFIMDKFKINSSIERLIVFLMVFLLACHICSCLWYFVAKAQNFSPESWVFRLGFMDASAPELYLISFHWTLTTITTVGYGDISAGTTPEKIYNLFIMSVGVIMYSFAIGSLSSIVANLDAKTEDLNRKLNVLESIRKEFKIDKNIYDKARKVIKFDLSQNQRDKINLLEILPNKLRIELSKAMYDTTIPKLQFFKKKPSDFVAYVSSFFKAVKFSQEHLLYKVGDILDESTVSLFIYDEANYGINSTSIEIELQEIKKYHNFGEIEMCLNKKLIYNIKIKSRICEMLILKKVDFLKLSVNHREHVEAFLNNSITKYLKFKNEHSDHLNFEAMEAKEEKNNKLEKMNSIKEQSDEEEDETYNSNEEENENENDNEDEGYNNENNEDDGDNNNENLENKKSKKHNNKNKDKSINNENSSSGSSSSSNSSNSSDIESNSSLEDDDNNNNNKKNNNNNNNVNTKVTKIDNFLNNSNNNNNKSNIKSNTINSSDDDNLSKTNKQNNNNNINYSKNDLNSFHSEIDINTNKHSPRNNNNNNNNINKNIQSAMHEIYNNEEDDNEKTNEKIKEMIELVKNFDDRYKEKLNVYLEKIKSTSSMKEKIENLEAIESLIDNIANEKSNITSSNILGVSNITNNNNNNNLQRNASDANNNSANYYNSANANNHS